MNNVWAVSLGEKHEGSDVCYVHASRGGAIGSVEFLKKREAKTRGLDYAEMEWDEEIYNDGYTCWVYKSTVIVLTKHDVLL
jgi:hypothetical protein